MLYAERVGGFSPDPLAASPDIICADGGSMRIYQAGPLFPAAEIRWHKDFKQKPIVAGHDAQLTEAFSRCTEFGHQGLVCVFTTRRYSK